jgi:hypothetical protein
VPKFELYRLFDGNPRNQIMPITITDTEALVLWDLLSQAAHRHDGAKFHDGSYVSYSALLEKLASGTSYPTEPQESNR